jgi:hypothetical protein
MKTPSALKRVALLLALAATPAAPRTASAQNLWTFFNVQVYNDWNDTVVVCWFPDCFTPPYGTVIYPDNVATLTGVSSVWAVPRGPVNLGWQNTAFWQNPQACILHQNNGFTYPQWTCGAPGQPPPGAERVPLTREQFQAWALTLRSKVTPDAQPLPLPKTEFPPMLDRMIKEAPKTSR